MSNFKDRMEIGLYFMGMGRDRMNRETHEKLI